MAAIQFGGFKDGGTGGCDCCGCACEIFHVLCDTSNAIGALVTIKSGGITIASGTTDSSGLVTLCVPAGTYMVTASGGTCTNGFSGTIDIACGGTYPLQCCFCDVTICIANCDASGTGGYYTCGATITITRDGVEVTSCHTLTGCCTFSNIGAGATATIQPDDTTGFGPTIVTTVCSTPDDPMIVGLTSASGWTYCCDSNNNQVAIPLVMTLTDGAGSTAFTFCATFDFVTLWTGCQLYSSSNAFGCDGENDCTVPGTYDILIQYQGVCNTDGTFTITRNWAWLDNCQAKAGPAFYGNFFTIAGGDPPIPIPASCADSFFAPECAYTNEFCTDVSSNRHFDCSTGTATFPLCGPYPLTFSMSPCTDPGPLGDPVGGPISIS